MWTYNSRILTDERFITKVNELFTYMHTDIKLSWGDRWELFKKQVKINAIERTTILNKQRRNNEKDLRQQLSTLLLEETINTGEVK